MVIPAKELIPHSGLIVTKFVGCVGIRTLVDTSYTASRESVVVRRGIIVGIGQV